MLGFSGPVIAAFLAGVVVTAALTWSYQNAPVRLQAQLADDCGEPDVEAATVARSRRRARAGAGRRQLTRGEAD